MALMLKLAFLTVFLFFICLDALAHPCPFVVFLVALRLYLATRIEG